MNDFRRRRGSSSGGSDVGIQENEVWGYGRRVTGKEGVSCAEGVRKLAVNISERSQFVTLEIF